MIDRIKKNEERLDNALASIKDLEKSLENFKANKKNIDLLNKYYGSKSWFIDREAFESHKIVNVKAGVLSEDAVWNMNEDIKDLIESMNSIICSYSKKD